MMPVMMMTSVIIHHHNLQEQITQDHLSLFLYQTKTPNFANNANNHVALQIPSFLLFPPFQVGGNLLFILREIQTEFSKRFPSREILPQM